MIQKYMAKISGPLLDRIDLHVRVPTVEAHELASGRHPAGCLEPSATVQQRIVRARAIQRARFDGGAVQVNAEMSTQAVKRHCRLTPEVEQLLLRAVGQFQLSARAYFKTIKVARTIADLAGAAEIRVSHLAEALQYRLRLEP